MDTLELLKQVLTGEVFDESYWQRVRPEGILASNPMKRWLAATMVRMLEARGYQVVLPMMPDPGKRERRQIGKDHPFFAYTMVGRKRLDNLEFCIRSIVKEGVPGDIVECGVWRGGAAILAKQVLNTLKADRNVWLCDSFEGLPAPTMQQDHGYDFTPANDYLGVSRETVESHFRRFSLLDPRVRFVKGFFKDSLPTVGIDEIAVLRLDGDLYESTIQCLDYLYHKVSAGGYVIVDDYGVLPPCRQAVHDFLNRHKLDPAIQDIDGTGVYWRVDRRLSTT